MDLISHFVVSLMLPVCLLACWMAGWLAGWWLVARICVILTLCVCHLSPYSSTLKHMAVFRPWIFCCWKLSRLSWRAFDFTCVQSLKYVVEWWKWKFVFAWLSSSRSVDEIFFTFLLFASLGRRLHVPHSFSPASIRAWLAPCQH